MPLPSLDNDKKSQDKSLPSLDEVIDNKNKLALEELDNVSLDDMYETVEEENEEKEPIKTVEAKFDMTNDINETNPFYTKEDYDFEEKPRRIDKEKQKIIPTGDVKSARRVDPSEFDDRTDAASKARLAQLIALIFIGGMLLLGVKNTFFPSNSYNPDEISMMAKNAMNETGFPRERGKALVEEFTAELLSTDSTDNGRDERLKKYMTSEEIQDGGDIDFFNVQGQSRQKIVQQPRVFNELLVNKNVAIYKVSAVVSDDTGDIVDQSSSYSSDLTHKVSLQMNVFYDEESDTLAIVKRTVSIIPNPAVTSDVKIKKENVTLGSGVPEEDQETVKSLQPIVYGFLTEYLDASRYHNDGIKQYIPSDAKVDLYDGFGGSVIFNGVASDSIEYTPYKGENPGEWKIFVSMSLRDANASNDTIVYNSNYIMTINQIGDVKLVTKFIPYNYLYNPDLPEVK